MIAVMQKAARLDDVYYEENLKRDQENISKLIIENKGLRELLDISDKFRSCNKLINSCTDNKISAETQTDDTGDILLPNDISLTQKNSTKTS